jgi:Cu+-exporting ATPase
MPSLALQISGMTCGSCAANVERALNSVPGVSHAAVNLTTTLATVQTQSPESDTQRLLEAVSRAGYSAKPVSGSSAQTLRDIAATGKAEAVSIRHRLTFGVLAAIPVLLIDLFAHRLMEIHSTGGVAAFASAQLLLSAAILAYTGRSFFVGAWRAAFRPNMDTLVALGSGIAFLYSAVTIIGWFFAIDHMLPHTELHAAITIVVLVLLGKYLESRAKRSANSAIAALANQSAQAASRQLPDGTFESIPADQIALGDTLQILAHQQLPVDGTLLEGAGSLDASLITGESTPLELALAPLIENQKSKIENPSTLPGGATLLDGRILLRATSTANTSAVARIMELVQNAQASKTHIQGLADRVAGIFVPIVLALGLLTFLGWTLAHHFGFALDHSALSAAIATIVIACPCAMGLATPTAITVATGTAARLGILFTNAAALETAAHNLTTILFDKTGTLTQGRLALHEIVVNPTSSPITQHSALALAASIEQFASHPLAAAIVAHAHAQNLTLADPDSFHSTPGGGVTATLNGTSYALGSPPFLQSQDTNLAPMQTEITRLQSLGMTLVALAQLPTKPIENQKSKIENPPPLPLHPSPFTPTILALFALRDTLRPEAPAALAALKSLGLHLGVLSGDTEPAVRASLKDLPFDTIRASVKPEEKAAAVTAAKSTIDNRQSKIPSTVAFVGDGINDAPALAAADLGIVMASGTDLAKAAGDVILISGSLASIPQTITLARKTLRIIRQNLFWAFAYNVAAIPLAVLGILPPSAAAAAMVFSSLTVVLNALRLYRV